MKPTLQKNTSAENHIMFLKKNSPMMNKTNNEQTNFGLQLNNPKKIDESCGNVKNSNYQYLDSSHLKMLDLNKNILNILPKPVEPSLNLEKLCKETNATLRNNTSIFENEHGKLKPNANKQDGNKNIKHFYELGLPEIVGTYIQPLDKRENHDMKIDTLEKFPFPLGSTSSSPFFQPPNFSTKLIPPSNNFSSLNINNKNTKNIYGLPSYLIPEGKPQNLTITVVPNKNKDVLEQEAKFLKTLLDNSSQGIVNSTPDYQKIISSPNLSNNKNHSNNNSSSINNNDIESDFSFGKNGNLETHGNTKSYDNDDNYEDSYNSFINEYYDENNSGSSVKGNEFTLKGVSYNNNENGINLKQNKKLEKANRKQNNKKNTISVFNELNGIKSGEKLDIELQNENKNEEQSTMVLLPSKKTQLTKKKEYNSSLKNQEPSTSFKNPKTCINIRLGKPKKVYSTTSSDPIDRKLQDWHNTHNSQIGWEKIRRGVYHFGKTEVSLRLIHDKIIVKKINGKIIDDNLLTVEKFVSLNELFELQNEDSVSTLKKKQEKRS
ncbi:conserved Plasmodium protein, unknown function [Plasmodium berghei]|uniref:Uncharacterized protein n=2 Tax=Plasmodium berghei TaxID=5821 RepID=A0A509AM40_PLABA|nr:conserved protein, unknown function [Plasmodium berghei ANKA]CXI78704.1 conserved Plasmodium protein, unknown function [Plasmodium berghei]SCM25211.1 conserved Plasmodium protein, unknown function [Plasmodium berghei]SCN27299.1 conserved Plasmodium protein, unknown function [Plasmodium berghei]SCO61913.1 conserved Plasmodium protein, unknown function [Plasmodium berghei]SCO63723.1 conserved Plasmodium protein, unknown function [Plasmodium berghei]|eukprot:XP_034422933.1 conserved protein, unknown function [Plasmodium berghei ANKA]